MKYYHRFIKDFATIANPVHQLIDKWITECQEAFKLTLISAPVLAHPLYYGEFILDTDASSTGIDAVYKKTVLNVLSPMQAEVSCVTRRELLAVVTFSYHFRNTLLGLQFSLCTDHSSLTWLQNVKEPDGQLACWITNCQGRTHENADAPSQPCLLCGHSDHPPQDPTPPPPPPLLCYHQFPTNLLSYIGFLLSPLFPLILLPSPENPSSMMSRLV